MVLWIGWSLVACLGGPGGDKDATTDLPDETEPPWGSEAWCIQDFPEPCDPYVDGAICYTLAQDYVSAENSNDQMVFVYGYLCPDGTPAIDETDTRYEGTQFLKVYALDGAPVGGWFVNDEGLCSDSEYGAGTSQGRRVTPKDCPRPRDCVFDEACGDYEGVVDRGCTCWRLPEGLLPPD